MREKNSSSIPYFKKEIFLLKFGGISLAGNESFGYRVYSYFIISVITYPYLIIAFGDLFKHEFEVVAQLCIYIGSYLMAVSITMVTFSNRIKLGKLLDKIQQKPFLPNTKRGGKMETELINQWILYKNNQYIILMAGAGICYTLAVAYTIMKRITSSNPQDWAFAFGPITFFNVTYSPNYEILWMYQNISVFCIVSNLLQAISILAAILTFDSKPHAKSTYEQDYTIDVLSIPWKYLESILRAMIRYHLSIIEIATDLENIFSNAMFSVYLFTLASLCFEIYRAAMVSIVFIFDY
ncbi:hypothetical protein ILUMI_11442 [Ignelater luminosus]|uniref:Uncharacterized protein n=1 Tax=Ignelater luminosus TaxID=2038154 RepID=A0A8K0CW78_IGNLU|nr:hypothetical protein ILUMI_11442 [Ignelater luminosus]